MKPTRTRRIQQEISRVDLTDWTLDAVDDWQHFTDKLMERITKETAWEKIGEKFQNHIRKAAAEAIEVAIRDGFVVHFSDNDGDVNITFRLQLDQGWGEVGPMYECSLTDMLDSAEGYEPELAKAFRAIADKLDRNI